MSSKYYLIPLYSKSVKAGRTAGESIGARQAVMPVQRQRIREKLVRDWSMWKDEEKKSSFNPGKKKAIQLEKGANPPQKEISGSSSSSYDVYSPIST